MIFTKSKALTVSLLACSLAVSACTQAEQSSTANTATGNNSTPVESVNTVPTATPSPAVLPVDGNAMSPAQVTTNNANQSPGNPPATSQTQPSSPAANASPPIVSSPGAQDFFVFTAVRGALNDDAELKNENITVDVKNGVVILTGSVTDEAKRKRAAQIADQAKDVKSVKNSLKIASVK